jgi:hypothetical protein
MGRKKSRTVTPTGRSSSRRASNAPDAELVRYDPDWGNDRTIVWCRDKNYGLLIQAGDVWAMAIEEAANVGRIRTIAELRRATSEYPWIEGVVEHFDLDEVEDETVVEHLRAVYCEWSLPVPWIDETVWDWLPDELAPLVESEGASPGGHEDALTWPADAVERFVALGWRAVESPEVLYATLSFPDVNLPR